MKWNIVLRWVARVWGVACFLVVLAFVAGGRESMRPSASEALGLLLFPGGVLIGFAVAWWREGLGGLISVISFAFFNVWLFSRMGRLPLLNPYFLILAAPAFIHAANALLSATRRGNATPVAVDQYW